MLMVITYYYSKIVRINRVRLPILLVVRSAERGKLMLFPCPRSRLRICWSREKTGSAVTSRVSLLISILRLNLVLTYGIPPEFRGGVQSNNPLR